MNFRRRTVTPALHISGMSVMWLEGVVDPLRTDAFGCIRLDPTRNGGGNALLHVVESSHTSGRWRSAIDENRSYFREDDLMSDEKMEQVLEHGQPSRMRARALWEWHPRSACGHGAEPT